MTIDEHFQFSQSSLQDFSDCARRFQLRYLEHISWPAVESEPLHEKEHLIELGAHFHRMVHQHLSGVTANQIERSIQDPQLSNWWRALRPFLQNLRGDPLIPEMTLSVPFQDHRLAAKFDLLVFNDDNRTQIIDWKTSPKKTPRDVLRSRLQTRVYPYVLAAAGTLPGWGDSTGDPPGEIQMLYWFPAEPQSPEKFVYSARQFAEDQLFLQDLYSRIISMITEFQKEAFPLTSSEKLCKYCHYRSLCGRGEIPGRMDEEAIFSDPDDELLMDIDLDQIAEIEY